MDTHKHGHCSRHWGSVVSTPSLIFFFFFVLLICDCLTWEWPTCPSRSLHTPVHTPEFASIVVYWLDFIPWPLSDGKVWSLAVTHRPKPDNGTQSSVIRSNFDLGKADSISCWDRHSFLYLLPGPCFVPFTCSPTRASKVSRVPLRYVTSENWDLQKNCGIAI